MGRGRERTGRGQGVSSDGGRLPMKNGKEAGKKEKKKKKKRRPITVKSGNIT